ncbi:hypothetical protein TRIP_D410162 [uncultured Paludibacter sp.]|nr:hypothetical protein TRIP_D410162 [uncultured Paludibacter sp.]
MSLICFPFQIMKKHNILVIIKIKEKTPQKTRHFDSIFISVFGYL